MAQRPSENRLSILPNPTDALSSKQNAADGLGVANDKTLNHETSIPENQNTPHQENLPAKIQTGYRLPVRSTRNSNPIYVDEISTGPPNLVPFSNHGRPWSASAQDIYELNKAIGA